MISAKALRDWFKATTDLASVTSGKLDTGKDVTAALYIGMFGTNDPPKMIRGYSVEAVRAILRCGKNGETSSDYALSVYNKLRIYRGLIGEENGFVTLISPEPVFIGTDSTGIYEYSIDFTITIEEV